jgi:hypothetical protein
MRATCSSFVEPQHAVTPGLGRHAVPGGLAEVVAEGVGEMGRRLYATDGRGVVGPCGRRVGQSADLSPNVAKSSGRTLAEDKASSPGQYQLGLGRENFMARNAHLRGPLSLLPAFLAAAGDRRRPSGGHGLVSKAQG